MIIAANYLCTLGGNAIQFMILIGSDFGDAGFWTRLQLRS